MGHQPATFGQQVNDCKLRQDCIFDNELKSVDCGISAKSLPTHILAARLEQEVVGDLRGNIPACPHLAEHLRDINSCV
jgi:hypothetical protein